MASEVQEGVEGEYAGVYRAHWELAYLRVHRKPSANVLGASIKGMCEGADKPGTAAAPRDPHDAEARRAHRHRPLRD